MKRKFKVGDVCRIRQWDDMAMEYGVHNDLFPKNRLYDYIPGSPRFATQMRYLCGKIFTIKSVRHNRYYASEEGIEGSWSVGNYMLEYAYPEPETDEDFDFTLNLADLFE